MDFFERQATARGRSRRLVVLFAIALVAMGIAIHVAITGTGVLLGLFPSLAEPSTPALVLIGILWLMVLLGCAFRYLDVRGGGPVLARRFGAVQASDRTREPEERTFRNVVAETAIAAGVRTPEAFVLRRETSVNAMVLGAGERCALVITQGALDAFDRDELQAVVAHEIGHIAAGDVELNMRLLVALGGLNALDEIGQMLCSRSEEGEFHPGMLIGFPLRALASVGTAFGSVIRAAVVREREFLADAAAVQFTRQPYALASALTVVAEAGDDTPLHDHRAAELVHLCFSGGTVPWYRRLLASHPSLQARIDAIDSHFAVKRRKLEKSAAQAVRQQGVGGMAATSKRQSPVEDAMRPTVGPAFVPSAVAAAAASGTVARQPATRPATLDINDSGLSDRLLLLLPDPRSCLGVLFALFAPVDPVERRTWLDAIAYSLDDGVRDVVKELVRLIPAELDGDRRAIIEHATGVLCRTLRQDSRRRVLQKLEALVARDGTEDLFDYATVQLVRRLLDVEFPLVNVLAGDLDTSSVAEAQGRRVKTFDAMGEEFALLLSLLVESSDTHTDTLDEIYTRVLACYTAAELPRRRSDEPGIVPALEAAFQTLYVQPRPIRQAFVEHCVEIVEADGRVMRRERALLDLFAASLGCDTALPSMPRAEPQRAARPVAHTNSAGSGGTDAAYGADSLPRAA